MIPLEERLFNLWDKLWTRYISEGKPTDSQITDIKSSRHSPDLESLILESRKLVANAMAKKFQDVTIDADGTGVLLGRTAIKPREFDAETIEFTVAVRPDYIDFSGKEVYSGDSLSKWRELFDKLGLKYTDTQGAVKAGYFKTNKISPFSEKYQLQETGSLVVTLNKDDLLERLGINELRASTMQAELIKYKAQTSRAEELGVNFVKYLEARGQQTDKSALSR